MKVNTVRQEQSASQTLNGKEQALWQFPRKESRDYSSEGITGRCSQ